MRDTFEFLKQQPIHWIDKDHDNIRAALDYALAQDEMTTVIEITIKLSPFWESRGLLYEGIYFLETALEGGLDIPERLQAQAMRHTGMHAWTSGDYDRAAYWLNRSADLWRDLNEDNDLLPALLYLAHVNLEQMKYDEACLLYEEILQSEPDNVLYILQSLTGLGLVSSRQMEYDVAREYYDQQMSLIEEADLSEELRPVIKASSIINFGVTYLKEGHFDKAESIFLQALQVGEQHQTKHTQIVASANLGETYYKKSDYEAARLYHQKCLELAVDQNYRIAIAHSLDGFAHLETMLERGENAARLFGAAEALRDDMGVWIPLNEQEDYILSVNAAQKLATPEVFEQAWQEGRALNLQQLIDNLLED